ncbi:hypothetical protein HF086_005817 [Spodoptera exigua]|uniref:U1 small nuclear ribonucleoprotein of 70kDa N-terminal domain-containing protein n=1 Tax=Spodoptera exigua TaxID=7107 RepID=A0A922M2P6_SPOEX|nr:hypothetical protein HF086_005817 [Spodoptera exigua]
MTQFLPPNLLALFAARDPIPYLPPAAKLPHEKKQKGYDGVGAFLDVFEICMIFNKDNNKPRGYAFIEYEHERDMHCKCYTEL